MSGNSGCDFEVNFSQAILINGFFMLEFMVRVSNCEYSAGAFSYSFSYTDADGALVEHGPKNLNWGNTQGQDNFQLTDNGGMQIPGDITNLTAVVDATTKQCTCLAGGREHPN